MMKEALSKMDESYLDGHSVRDMASTLRVQDKSKYVSKAILDLLDAHKSTGLTISDLIELTGLDRGTVSKHLEILVVLGYLAQHLCSAS